MDEPEVDGGWKTGRLVALGTRKIVDTAVYVLNLWL